MLIYIEPERLNPIKNQSEKSHLHFYNSEISDKQFRVGHGQFDRSEIGWRRARKVYKVFFKIKSNFDILF